MTAKNCLDCLHCKMIQRRKKLSCKAGFWMMETDEKLRVIILDNHESRTLSIKPRKIFDKAQTCTNFCDMTENEVE